MQDIDLAIACNLTGDLAIHYQSGNRISMGRFAGGTLTKISKYLKIAVKHC